MKKGILLTAFVFCCSLMQSAINPVWEWLKIDSSGLIDFTFHNNCVYTIGNYLKKWDTSGNLIWTKPISGKMVRVDYNGDIVVLATLTVPTITIENTTLTNNGGSDIVLIKTDNAGNLIWAYNYGGAGNDIAKEFCIDNNNNIYLNADLLPNTGIVKYTANGVYVWTKQINDGFVANMFSRTICYSEMDSTIVIATQFTGTFYIDNLYVVSVFGQVWGQNPDVYVAKIDLNSNLIFLINLTNHYRSDQLTYNIYSNKNTGVIYIPVWTITMSGSRAHLESVTANGTYVGTVYDDGIGYINPIMNVSGDDDSLISVFSNTSNTVIIKNLYTAVTKNYNIPYTLPTLFGNGRLYFMDQYQYQNQKLGKLGDVQYTPMSVFFLNDADKCSGVPFNTNCIINSGYWPFTISWSPATGLTNPAALNPGFNLDTSMTYELTVTDNNNAVFRDTVTFTVHQNPNDSITALGNTFFCAGINDSVQLTCSMPQFVNKWTGSNLGIVAIDTLAIQAYPNHTYTLTTTDTSSGCFSQSTFQIGIHPAYPAVLSDAIPTAYNDTLIICNSTDSVVLKNFHYNNIQASDITWYRNGSLIDSNVQYVKTNSSGQYLLKIRDSVCYVTDTLELIYASPQIQANASSSSLCAGDSLQLFGSGGSSYVWSNNVSDSVLFTPGLSSLYHLTGTDMYGCSAADSIFITVFPVPLIQINASSSSVCAADSLLLFGSGGLSYVWSNNVSDSVQFIPVQSSLYHLTGTDIYGCSSADSLFIPVFPVYHSVEEIGVCYDGSYYLPDGHLLIHINHDTTYLSYLKTSHGCDSNILSEIFIRKLDTTVSVSRMSFQSEADGVTYQWYYCDSELPVSDATAKIFFPEKSGSYYVQVSMDSCIEKSSCYSYVRYEDQGGYCIISPNPATSQLVLKYHCETDGNFRLYNSVGQVVFNTGLPKDKLEMYADVSGLSRGVYTYEAYFKNKRSYKGKISIVN